MTNNHKYKIGQRVYHGLSKSYVYIVGIETIGYFEYETKLIVSESKDTPTRLGFPTYPCFVEIEE